MSLLKNSATNSPSGGGSYANAAIKEPKNELTLPILSKYRGVARAGLNGTLGKNTTGKVTACNTDVIVRACEKNSAHKQDWGCNMPKPTSEEKQITLGAGTYNKPIELKTKKQVKKVKLSGYLLVLAEIGRK